MNATTKVSYDPSNFAALVPIEERAAELMNRAKDGAAALKKKIHEAASQGADLTAGFQVVKPDGGHAILTGLLTSLRTHRALTT